MPTKVIWETRRSRFQAIVSRVSLVTFMCPSAELTWVTTQGQNFLLLKLGNRNWAFLDQNQEKPLIWIGPNKYIDENLALNFSDGSEVWSFKTKKSHGLSLS